MLCSVMKSLAITLPPAGDVNHLSMQCIQPCKCYPPDSCLVAFSVIRWPAAVFKSSLFSLIIPYSHNFYYNIFCNYSINSYHCESFTVYIANFTHKKKHSNIEWETPHGFRQQLGILEHISPKSGGNTAQHKSAFLPGYRAWECILLSVRPPCLQPVRASGKDPALLFPGCCYGPTETVK